MSSQITEQELDNKLIPELKSIVLGYLESQIIVNKFENLYSVVYEDNEIIPIGDKYVITRRISNHITFRVNISLKGNDFIHDLVEGDGINFNVNDEQFSQIKKEMDNEINRFILECNVRKLIEKEFVKSIDYIFDTVLDLTKIDNFLEMAKICGIYVPYSSIELNEFYRRSPYSVKHYVGKKYDVNIVDLQFKLEKDILRIFHV